MSPKKLSVNTTQPKTQLIVVAMWFWFLVACGYSQFLPYELTILYGALSLLSFCAYGWDKWAAIRGLRRVRENTLHTMDAIGGWPGGGLAQAVFRHKTIKSSFRRIYWITIIINLLIFAYFWTPNGQAILKLWVPYLRDFFYSIFKFAQ